MTILKGQVETDNGDVLYPHTTADVVFDKNGKSVESHLADLAQLSNPNLIINGDFPVWQRGSIFNSGHSKYTADRWYLAYHSASSYEIKSVVNGLSIKSDGNNHIFIKQLIENSLKFIGCKVTLSIKIDGIISKSSAIVPSSGDFCSMPIGAYLQVTDKTLNVVYHTSSATPKIIEWVKLELGDKATPFTPRTYAEELIMCQRYFEKSYDTVAIDSPNDARGACQGIVSVANKFHLYIPFKVNKRIDPTINLFDYTNATKGSVTNLTLNNTSIPAIVANIGQSGFFVISENNSTLRVGDNIAFHWEADTEIY